MSKLTKAQVERTVKLRSSFVDWLCGSGPHPDTGQWFNRPVGRGEFWWRREVNAEIERPARAGRKK